MGLNISFTVPRKQKQKIERQSLQRNRKAETLESRNKTGGHHNESMILYKGCQHCKFIWKCVPQSIERLTNEFNANYYLNTTVIS